MPLGYLHIEIFLEIIYSLVRAIFGDIKDVYFFKEREKYIIFIFVTRNITKMALASYTSGTFKCNKKSS